MLTLKKGEYAVWLHTGLGALAGVAIALSTALQNLSVALLVLFGAYLLATQPQVRHAVLRSPLVWGCIVLWLAFAVGMLYTQANSTDAWRMLSKMRAYALVPFIFAAFTLLNLRRGAVWGFAGAVMLTVLATYVLAMLGKQVIAGPADSPSYSLFRTHTYHSLIAAFLATGLLALLLTQRLTAIQRALAITAIALIASSIFLLVVGRGGQLGLVLMVCASLVVWQPRRGLLAAAAVLTVFALVLSSVPKVQDRFILLGDEISEFQQGKREVAGSSMGERLTFWSTSVKLLKVAPLQGYGTGSYGQLYANASGHTDAQAKLGRRNPHNDYFWITIELGVIGALALAAMLAGSAVQAWRAPLPARMLALAWLFTMVLGCLFNSFWTDNLGSHAFVVIMCCLCAPGNNLSYQNSSDGLS